MKMIERWEWIEEGMGIVLLPVCRGHEFNDRFGIFNHMSVTVDDRMAFEWHKSSPPITALLYVINQLHLVKTGFAVASEIFERGFVMNRCCRTISDRADHRCRFP